MQSAVVSDLVQQPGKAVVDEIAMVNERDALRVTQRLQHQRRQPDTPETPCMERHGHTPYTDVCRDMGTHRRHRAWRDMGTHRTGHTPYTDTDTVHGETWAHTVH